MGINRFKKLLSIVLTAFLLFSTVPTGITASAEVISGTTGDCTWTLDGTHLTISGNGNMEDYHHTLYYTLPWGTGITSVTIEDGVTRIGASAFEYCTSLTSVTIPDSVTSIGFDAFFNCTNLKDVYYTGNLSAWCKIKFGYCNSNSNYNSNPMRYATNLYINGKLLEGEITIPDDVTSIGDYTFSGCKSLTGITIPNSVTNISSSAFSGCTSLATITVDKNNGNYSSVDGVLCNKDKSVLIECPYGKKGEFIIPDSVTSIDESTFSGCKSLTGITIPDSVTNISSSAFSGCTSLASVTIGNGLTSISSSVFEGCTGLTSVTIGNSVTIIGNYAFSGCTSLTSITIPDSVTIIGDNAFYGCRSLASITIPDSVTYIDHGAFYNTACYNNDKNWTDGVLYIGNYLIGAKEDIVHGNYTIRQGTKCIAGGAFSYCESLTSITIPDSVTIIGYMAFRDCKGLTSITIPDSVTSISDSAFDGCKINELIIADGSKTVTRTMVCMVPFEKVTIPDSVTSIGAEAFSHRSLTSITIPDSVTSIGAEAFSYCSLTSITIPDSVTSIGGGAFSYCIGLENVYYVGNLSDWCKIKFGNYDSNPMYYAANLYINGKLLEGEITIPDDITSIGYCTFQGCKSLTSINIPDSVTSIGVLTFSDCTGLTSITIPDSVTSIGGSAFFGCTGLTSITIPDSVASIGGYAFYGCDNLVIKTTENSAAHKYAVENNIKYELIKPVPVTVEGDDKNITISTDSSVIPSTGVSLSTEKVENIGEKYETQLKNLGAEKFTAYNIDLMKGEEKVQPNGKVTVSIAVPDGMDGAKCKVYRAESDGTLTDMKASLNDGKLTFTTDHFSLYIITQSAVKLGDVNGDGQVTIKDAIAILRHNAEVELLTGSQIIAGDLNGDGTVNPKDAILLLQYNAQIIDKFPIE